MRDPLRLETEPRARDAPRARAALSGRVLSLGLGLVLLLATGCEPVKVEPRSAAAAAPTPARPAPAPGVDLAAARELDSQGARAFTEGRFREASRYFDEAHKRGGPAHEIWNMARCEQKLDDLEEASKLLERYLEQKNLSPGDREEARRQLADMLRKPSRVTVITSPPGAAVFVGDRRSGMHGRTPLTLELAPGDHVLTLELGGHDPETERVTARYGRSVIVEATLSK